MRQNADPSPETPSHRHRCSELPPLRAGEVERLTAAFLAANRITVCPTRYAVPEQTISRSWRRTFESL